MTDYIVEVQVYVTAPDAAKAEHAVTQAIAPHIRRDLIEGWRVTDVRGEDES